jgi:hypothetical protein
MRGGRGSREQGEGSREDVMREGEEKEMRGGDAERFEPMQRGRVRYWKGGCGVTSNAIQYWSKFSIPILKPSKHLIFSSFNANSEFRAPITTSK